MAERIICRPSNAVRFGPPEALQTSVAEEARFPWFQKLGVVGLGARPPSDDSLFVGHTFIPMEAYSSKHDFAAERKSICAEVGGSIVRLCIPLVNWWAIVAGLAHLWRDAVTASSNKSTERFSVCRGATPTSFTWFYLSLVYHYIWLSGTLASPSPIHLGMMSCFSSYHYLKMSTKL